MPQSAGEIAKQLRQNLKATGYQPPYVLVGHSAGGLYVNMYARMYPNEVVGVVLLDSSHPEQFQYFKEEKELLYSMLISSSKGKRSYEGTIIRGVNKEFEEAPAFPQIPLTVLSSGKRSSIFEGSEMRAKWLEFQDELAAMSGQTTYMVVEGSGHFVHKDKPEVVIDAIKRLTAESKQEYLDKVY